MFPKELTLEDLKPMSEAPRDGSDILAYNQYTKWFCPVHWLGEESMWTTLKPPHWVSRWSKDFEYHDKHFLGWIPYPVIVKEDSNTTN